MKLFAGCKKSILFFIAIFTFLLTTGQTLPTNDECNGAIKLMVSAGNSCSNIYNTNTGYATQSMPPCYSTPYDARDVWFKFVATATTHRVRVYADNRDFMFEAFSGTCGNLTSIACVNTGGYAEQDIALLTGLTIGHTYYVRVYNYYGGATPDVGFSICVNEATALVDNDDCASAQEIVPSLSQEAGVLVYSNNYGATQSMPGCTGTAEDDIWYKFKALKTRHKITAATEVPIEPVLEVFSGDCNSLLPVLCLDKNANNYDYVIGDLTNLVPGNYYYYRIYGRAATNTRTTIRTSIFSPPPPPANDECSGAIALEVNADATCSSIYSSSTGSPTQSMPSCSSTIYDAKDIWFKFTATATTHKVSVTPVSYDRFAFEAFSGSCGNLSSIACVSSEDRGEPTLSLLNNLTVGATYFLRLYDYYGNGTIDDQFKICISTTAVAAANDDCSGATEVTPSEDHFITVNNTGATQSMPGCQGSAEDDVWLKFTAATNRYRILVGTNSYINPVLEVFDGSCGSLTSLACRYNALASSYDNVDVDLSTFVPGMTYYFRIYGSAADNIRTNINVYVIPMGPSPANDECSGAIDLSVSADTSCNGMYAGNFENATQSIASCVSSGYDAKDIWFKFKAVASTQRITVTPVSFSDNVFEVFSGDSAGLSSILCVNNGRLNEPDVALLTNLAVGKIYYIRVYDYYGSATANRQFNICVNSASQYANNDDCSGALSLNSSATSDPDLHITAHNIGATQSMTGCYGTADDDIWFTFKATSNHHKIIVATESLIKPVLEVFSGACGFLTSLACRYTANVGDYDFIDADLTNLSPGTTYYYRVYGTESNNAGTSIRTYVQTFAVMLSVELISFEAHRNGTLHELSWQTVTESNNKGFLVEASKDGTHFDSLRFVPSLAKYGSSTQPLFYAFSHPAPISGQGTVFYRLKEVDLNGNSKYSRIIPVSSNDEKIIVSPNPVSDYLYVVSGNTAGYSYRLFDNTGKRVKEGLLKNGRIRVGGIAKGVYYIQIADYKRVQTFKLIKE